MMQDIRDVKDTLDAIKINDIMDIVSVVNVWSNGNKIRRYTGQGEDSEWHKPKDGYRKMVAILVEID